MDKNKNGAIDVLEIKDVYTEYSMHRKTKTKFNLLYFAKLIELKGYNAKQFFAKCGFDFYSHYDLNRFC